MIINRSQIRQPLLLLLMALPLSACFAENIPLSQTANPAPKPITIPSVDVVKARQGFLTEPKEYIGTTQPLKQVKVKSQAEGQLLTLTVDVGDRVNEGDVIAQLDDSLPRIAVSRAEGELARLESELVEAEAQVIAAQAEVESAQVQLLQAQTDLARLEQLFDEGAIARRELELAKTEKNTSKQLVAAARSQVQVREARIMSIQGEIASQRAVITAEKKRLTYTQIKAPTSGYILDKLTEIGNLVQVGEEIITIGDLSQVKVEVAVSELDLEQIRVSNQIDITLDAFPNKKFVGIIKTISPVADTRARQIPIEILLSNPSGTIKSGLLARVTFLNRQIPPIIIPELAINLTPNASEDKVFVVKIQEEDVKVRAKRIRVGKVRNGKVEILSGLTNEDKVVTRTTTKLEDGQSVKLSAISVPLDE